MSDSLEYDLFVSYARKDFQETHQGFLEDFLKELREQFTEFSDLPLRTFCDTQSIPGTADWQTTLKQGLRRSFAFLAFVSPNYLASSWCRFEWMNWIEHERHLAMPYSAATVYIVTSPILEGREIPADEIQAFIDDVSRRQRTIDLRDFWTEGVPALKHRKVSQRIEKLNQELQIRIKRAQRHKSSKGIVPAHNETFVGRESELACIFRELTGGRVGVPVAICGLAGLGKSAIAYEYAHVYAQQYPGGRFALSTAGKSDLRLVLGEFGQLMGISFTEEEQKDLDARALRVWRFLENGPCRLLVLDNVDDADLISESRLAELLPRGEFAHYLVTTRHDITSAEHLISLALDPMSTATGVALFEKFDVDPHSEQLLRLGNDVEREAAAKIVEQLGGHALCLELIAAYLKKNPSVAFVDYLERLNREGIDALLSIDQAGVTVSRHRETNGLRLFLPSFKDLSALERAVCQYAALLPPDRIALPWIKQALYGLSDELGATETPRASVPWLHRLRTCVRQFWLPNPEPQPGYPDPWVACCHRLEVARVFTRDEPNAAGLPRMTRMHRLLRQVIQTLSSHRTKTARWNELDLVVRHRVQTLRETWWQPDTRWEIPALTDFLHEALEIPRARFAVGSVAAFLRVLHMCGNLVEAQALASKAMQTATQRMKGSAPDRLRLETQYSVILQAMGEFDRAMEIMTSAIERWQRKSHCPDFGDALCDYGWLLEQAARFDESRTVLLEAIKIHRRAKRDPQASQRLARDYEHLALVEEDLGNLNEALTLGRQAVAIDQQQLGTDAISPQIADRCSDLALIELACGNVDAARWLQLRAKEISEQIFGEVADRHYYVAIDYSNLADIELAAGNFDLARRHAQQALEIDRRAFGPQEDHMYLASDYHRLAMIELAAEEVPLATEFIAKARDIAQRVKTPVPYRLANVYDGSAQIRLASGDRDAACEDMRQALKICLDIYGEKHAATLEKQVWINQQFADDA